MTMGWLDLKHYIGSEDVNDDAYITECWTEAVILVDQAFKGAFRPKVTDPITLVVTVVVPQAIKDRCYQEVGSELYNRKNAPSGGSQFATFDGGTQPVRGPRDPMSQVRPIIRQYVVAF